MARQFRIMMMMFCAAGFYSGFFGILSAEAQTVQLPTFSYTTVNTTVSVPDRGGMYLGGVGYSSIGSSEAGTPILPFKNRSSGRSTRATGMSVSAYIHDFEEMEQELLKQPSPTPGFVGGGRSSGGSMMNLRDNVQERQMAVKESASLSSGKYTLGGRANRALMAKRENASLEDDLDLSVKETPIEKRKK